MNSSEILLFLLATATSVSQPCIVVPLPIDSLTACQLVLEEGQAGSKNGTLEAIPVNNKTVFHTVVDFVSRVFSANRNGSGNVSGGGCSEVIGVVGDLDLKTASIIRNLTSRANLSITLVSAVAPSTFLPATHLALPNLLHMNPLTHYVEALAAFLDHLNWTRIGLISDHSPYYQFAAELIQQKLLENPERRIIPFVRISERDNRTNIIQTFKEYETDVIIISALVNVACSLVQEAKRVGFMWPEYAWILFDFSLQPLPETCQEEGVILLRDESSLEESSNYQVRCSSQEAEKLLNSSLLTNALLAAYLARSSYNLQNTSFSGTNNKQVQFREGKQLFNVSIIQIDTSMSISDHHEVGLYITEAQQLNVFVSFSETSDKPRGTILELYIHYDDYYTLRIGLVMCLFFTLLTFVTIVFVLYIYFRKEPEIKATSVTVSMAMFLGCFILISHSPILVTDRIGDDCIPLIWLGLSGISLPLISATLIVKMLRVYLIFSDPVSFKKKLFTDPFLFLYILLLVSPSFTVLLLWSIYDPFTLTALKFHHETYILTYNGCQSNYTIHWLGALLFYYFMLSLAMLCLAIKTSKIRFKHIRDTKATNAFTFLSSFIAVQILIYWYFLYLQEPHIKTVLASHGVSFAAHIIIVVLCQGLLFVPKVYPPLKRKLTRNQVKRK